MKQKESLFNWWNMKPKRTKDLFVQWEGFWCLKMRDDKFCIWNHAIWLDKNASLRFVYPEVAKWQKVCGGTKMSYYVIVYIWKPLWPFQKNINSWFLPPMYKGSAVKSKKRASYRWQSQNFKRAIKVIIIFFFEIIKIRRKY